MHDPTNPLCTNRFRSMAERLDEHEDRLAKLDEAIRGNGKPGLNVRVDRLEEREKTRTRLFWIVLTALAAIVIPAAVKILVTALPHLPNGQQHP